MKLQKKTEGAISVFLVIILVPCLFITSLFVDVGRVYLSKGMAYSSADLALNSVLTNYDADLNEWYGLIASCQNVNDFYDISEAYFLRTLSSQNLTEDEIKLLTDTFETVVGETIEAYGGEGNEVHDLLKTESVGDVTIEPVDGANLSNSALLKEQMVEFMKYRGPITMVTSITEMLTDEKGNYLPEVGALLDSKTDEPIIEAKQEFHDAETEFLAAAYKSYSYLYNNYSNPPVENSYLTDSIDYMNETMDVYEEIHGMMVPYWFNTDNLDRYERTVEAELDTKYVVNLTTIWSYLISEYDEEAKEIHYRINGEMLSLCVRELETAITEFNNAVNAYVNAAETVPYVKDKTHDVQYWCQVSEIIYGLKGGVNHVEKVESAALNMRFVAMKVAAILSYERGDNVSENDINTCNQLLEQVQTLSSQYLSPFSSSSSNRYIQIVSRLEDISGKYMETINYSNYRINKKDIDTELNNRSTKLYNIKNGCQKYVDILTIAIDGDEKKGIVSLDELYELAEAYKDSYNAYSNTVNNAPQTTLQKKMAEDIDTYDKNAYKDVSADAVKDMKERLSNIRSQYQSVIDAIDSMKYGKTSMLKINSFSSFRDSAKGVVKANEIGLTESEVESYTQTTFDKLISPNLADGTDIVDFNETDDYNLFLKPERDEVKLPKLYQFFYAQFGPPNDDAVKEQEEEMGKAKDASEKNNSEKVAEQLLNEDAKSVASMLSSGYTSQLKMGTGFGVLLSVVEDVCSGDFTEFRDKAYIAAYIMEMFSCATYEREGLYGLYEAGGNDVLLLDGNNYASYYKNYEGTGDGKWESVSAVDSYNKSLTNQLINAKNNGAYLCELEYLLYGNSSNAENIKSACGDIFKIRLLLNTISGFVNFWGSGNATASTILTAARAASTASGRVIPEAAIKTVLIMVLVATETCNDMSRLACGFPVELYKIKDIDWIYSLESADGTCSGISAFMNKLQDGMVENTGKGFTYSDYINLFVCMMVWDNNTSETIVLRTGDLIQLNMQQVTGNESYQLSNAHTHFELNAKLRVDPLLVDIPFFNEYNEELKDSTGWLEYNVSTIRGY